MYQESTGVDKGVEGEELSKCKIVYYCMKIPVLKLLIVVINVSSS
jgi:hypothetical protein